MQFFTDTHFDFMGMRHIAYVISIVFILAGLVSLVLRGGPDLGIDFKGGVDVQARFSKVVDISDVRSTLTSAGVYRPSVRRGNTRQEVLISAAEQEVPISEATAAAMKEEAKRVLGSKWSVNFSDNAANAYSIQADFSEPVSTDEVSLALQDEGLAQLSVSRGETSAKVVISIPQEEDVGDGIKRALVNTWGVDDRAINIEDVGAAVGRDLEIGAIKSIILALILIIIYMWFRFELRFGVAAVLCLVHDVLVTFGLFSILREEINLPAIAGFLTIIGYSLNDTIVIFDRIRENMRLHRGMDFDQIINNSINETLSRTIITALTTLFSVIAIFAFARVGALHTLSLSLLIGVIAGSYSTVFVASPILHGWHIRLQRGK